MRSFLILLISACCAIGTCPVLGQTEGNGAIQAAASTDGREIEIYPRYFTLRVGEMIHYTVLERDASGKPRWPDRIKFQSSDPAVVELLAPKGVFQACSAGQTKVTVQVDGLEKAVEIRVSNESIAPMRLVADAAVERFEAADVLIVNHANRDGYDHTSVAKPGIDRWVRRFKEQERPVIYLASEDYPNWYCEDRSPTHAVHSEGGEHRIAFLAERVYLTGGDFNFCLLRAAQFTLHRLIHAEEASQVHFCLPAEAIWAGKEGSPYPAEMATLEELFEAEPNGEAIYHKFIQGFLDRLIDDYPLIGYPANAPGPHLKDLIKGYGIEVKIGDDFVRSYSAGDAEREITLEFILSSESDLAAGTPSK